MYASEEPSAFRKGAEIATWILLFIALVPGTALGYFAENSLPNSPLYPVKRGIETVVLALTTVNNGVKTRYELSLAQVRLKETKQVFASSSGVTPDNFTQLDSVAAQIADAKTSLGTVTNSVQKAELQQQLATTVADYKTQLTQMQQQLNTSNQTAQTNTTQRNGSDTSTTSHTASPTSSPETTTQAPTSTSSSDITLAPNFGNLTPDEKTALQQKIQEISDQLDALEASPTPEQDKQQSEKDQQDTHNQTQDNNQRQRDHQGDTSR